MSDTIPSAGQGTEQPEVQAPETGSADQPVTQPQAPDSQAAADTPLTREEALRLLEERDARILLEAQRYSDKGRVRLQQTVAQVQQAVETMRSLGREVSDQEAEAMRAQAIQKAMTSADDDTSDQAPQLRTDLQYAPLDYYAEGYRLEGQHGFTIDPEDPEIKQIKISGNKEADLKSLQKAFATKAKRLAPASTPSEHVPAGDPTRVPAPRGPRGQEPAKSASEIWKTAYKGK